MLFVGIDPGVQGGIATINEKGDILAAVGMPDLNVDLLAALTKFAEPSPTGRPMVRAMLERVSASPQMGVVSAFTFGKGIGRLEMALDAAMIPFDLVAPVKWQNALGCRSGGDKNVTKRRAAQLYPGTKITHAIADALLLAEYARQLNAGRVR